MAKRLMIQTYARPAVVIRRSPVPVANRNRVRKLVAIFLGPAMAVATFVASVSTVATVLLMYATWYRSEHARIANALIDEGWAVMALPEVYMLVDDSSATKNYATASLAALRDAFTVTANGELVPDGKSNFKVVRVDLLGAADQHIWNASQAQVLFSGDTSPRLWVLRDRVIDRLSFAAGNRAALDPHPLILSSKGLWHLVAWIEKCAIAREAGMLTDEDMRVLRRPLTSFSGPDRVRWLHLVMDALSPRACEFLREAHERFADQPCIGDVTYDDLFDDQDEDLIRERWGTDDWLCDINGDGLVDNADLAPRSTNRPPPPPDTRRRPPKLPPSDSP